MNKFCKNCGVRVINSKFCNNCVSSVENDEGGTQSSSAEISELNYNKTTINNQTACGVCGKVADLKYVEFHENRGALVMRYHREIKGNLCIDCINKYFWKFTLITLFIGWFGVISFIVTPFIIINNVFRYLWTKLK